MRATGCNRVVAFSSVVGPVSRDATDGLVWRDLLEQFLQHGRVADIAGGDLDRRHFQCFFVDPYVYLAPYPAFRAAVFASVPFPFAFRLDAGTVHCPAGHCEEMSREGSSRLSGPVPPRKGRLTFSVFWPLSADLRCKSPAGQWDDTRC